ncbi:STAS domain-containing protein [Phaeospirillum tilakii]|uniref:STAS domain-containing protein n=1 Tax=Phaeospirillum tilakii TaxID=741673 RepID=A0ABW5CAQ1_9PROT
MDQNGQEQVVVCSGTLGLARAAELRDLLQAALADGPDLLIDCSAATDVDLSFIQLVLAVRQSAERRGGRVRLRHPAHGPLASALRAAGLTGLPAGGGDSSFWTEGT